MLFRQLFESISSTYTYILACERTRHALIIDPVLETVDRDVQLIQELELIPRYVVNTHVHADHVSGSAALRRHFPELRSGISRAANANADHLFESGERLSLGSDLEVEIRATPGHTAGCVTYVIHNQRIAFTGDALLIRGCGRTDFQGGDPARLYASIHREILSLPRDYRIYPAHDYRGRLWSSVDEELKFNPRLTKSIDEFVALMNGLRLPKPKQFDKAVPVNLQCGDLDLMSDEFKQKYA